MKKSHLISLLALFVMLVGSVSVANAAITEKVKSFDYLIDDSGSMMMRFPGTKSSKMNVAKEALTLINDAIPAQLKYNASMHTFAPYKELAPLAPFNKAEFNDIINKIDGNKEIFGRLTPMGTSFAKVAASYVTGLQSPAALIVVTDGVSNFGPEPLTELRSIYERNSNICVHFVSVAADAAGERAIESMAALNPCSRIISAADVIDDAAKRNSFVADVFYTSGDEPIVFSTNAVHFALGSAVISKSSKDLLLTITEGLKAQNGTIVLSGHTCDLGSDRANQSLSERRALAVKAFLVDNGIPASRIQTRGYGESTPRVPNTSEANRKINRRVEFEILD